MSGCLIGVVLLTILSPSREDLGIYPEKHSNMSTGGSGKELRNVSVTRRRLGPGKAKYLYDGGMEWILAYVFHHLAESLVR